QPLRGLLIRTLERASFPLPQNGEVAKWLGNGLQNRHTPVRIRSSPLSSSEWGFPSPPCRQVNSRAPHPNSRLRSEPRWPLGGGSRRLVAPHLGRSLPAWDGRSPLGTGAARDSRLKTFGVGRSCALRPWSKRMQC